MSLTGYVLKYALAATAEVAPLLGTLFTIFRILGCFNGTSGPTEAIFPSLAMDLTQSLIPFACGLAIGILAKLAHGNPTAIDKPSGAGIDRAAKQLFEALTVRRFKIPALSRGGLDTLPTVVQLAHLLALILVLDSIIGNLAALAAAILLAQFTRFMHNYLDAQHQTLESEMDRLATALSTTSSAKNSAPV